MAATTTFAKLQQYIRRTAARDGATSFDDDHIKAAIPDGFRKLEARRDWSFLRRTVRIATTAPYATGTLTSNHGSSDPLVNRTLDFAGSTLPTGIEGQFIEINGEQTWYEIESRTNDTSLVLRTKYRGPIGTGTSGLSFKILFPNINLPNDFKSYRKLVPLGGIAEPRYMPPETMLDMHQNFAGAAQPWKWTEMERTDDTGQMLVFFPPPDAVYQYDLRYNRRIGYLDVSAANAWIDGVQTAPAEDDIVLWDDRQMAVLRAAIVYAGYQEFENAQLVGMAADRFERAVEEASANDSRNKELTVFGGGHPDRPYWY
jgi:hypothetical protein